MNNMSAYIALLNKFGKKLEDMIQTDFPDNPELSNDIDMALTQIQFMIALSFLFKRPELNSEFLKGESNNG